MVEITLDKRDRSPPRSEDTPALKKQSLANSTEESHHEEITNNIEDDTKQNKPQKKRIIKYKNKSCDPTSPTGVLKFEIQEILKEFNLEINDISNNMNDLLNDEDIMNLYHRDVNDVKILKLTSNGDGIALVQHPNSSKKFQIVIIPFAIPGDTVNIRIFKTHPNYVESDLLSIITPSQDRNDSLVKCGYFGRCSGCQYQMLNYSTQLKWKRETILNAYNYLAKDLVKSGKIPEIGSTFASPKEFSYRTKLTPHFDIKSKRRGTGPKLTLAEKGVEVRPSFGFGAKGKSNWRNCKIGGDQATLDIEECIIGTKIVNVGLTNERNKFVKNWGNYKKSATVLLREHTKVFNKDDIISNEIVNKEESSKDEEDNVSYITEENDKDNLVKTCVINPRQIVTEYVNGFTFEFSAGEFFQNNNSILPLVTNYVCENLQISNKPTDKPLYLVDAYCGSGLFSITASKGVDRVVGVDVSKESIKFANLNAERNGVTNVKFIDGKAEKIFNEITTPNDLTSVIIDPSRKGCDDVFLNQLSDYKPARVVYVSCNVHSQARDLQKFIQNTENGRLYTIESIRGFDFFPQTHHVESVAVISRKVEF